MHVIANYERIVTISYFSLVGDCEFSFSDSDFFSSVLTVFFWTVLSKLTCSHFWSFRICLVEFDDVS